MNGEFDDLIDDLLGDDLAAAARVKADVAPKPDPRHGKPIEIEGIARESVLSAVVEADNGAVYHLGGMDYWPDDDVIGKRVTVSGTFHKRDLAPDPVVEEDGSVSHGAVGAASVIDDCQIKVHD